MKKLVLLSGGLDSATLLKEIKMVSDESDIFAVIYRYGQKAERKEIKAAKEIADEYGIKLIERNLGDIFASSGSSLILYNAQPVTKILSCDSHTEFISPNTEIEFRNGVLLASGISLAMQLWPGIESTVYIGIIQMREPYSDCSSQFIRMYDRLAQFCSKGKVRVKAPYVDFGKDIIAARAKKLNVPIQKTWSCYEGGEKSCGICPACLDRRSISIL